LKQFLGCCRFKPQQAAEQFFLSEYERFHDGIIRGFIFTRKSLVPVTKA
jgi:hypothetical protein